MNEPIRVLIVDDHPLFRDGLRSSLAAQSGYELVGEAADGRDAVAMAVERRPDVVLMDLHLPGLDGVTATRQILERLPSVRVLVVTMLEDDVSVAAALRAGARGYLVKGSTAETVLRAVSTVAEGGVLVGPLAAERLLAMDWPGGPGRGPDAFPELTERERETLALIGRGLRNGQIAAQMHVTSKTVRNYISRIFSKLAITTRAEAVIRARDAGLG